MRPGKAGVRSRLSFEHLEDRTLPTTAALTGSVLNVLGSSGADNIQIDQINGAISVSGVSSTFAATQVKLISVEAGAADDVVTIGQSVTTPAWVFGNTGNDRISAGGGQTTVYGGSGNDTITGGAGADVLYGGPGTNSVTGQSGDQASQGTAFASMSASAIAQDVVRLTNEFRAANGLPPLQISGQLTAMANLQATNMVNLVPVVGYSAAMSHLLYGSPEATLTSRADYVGYDWSSIGENIAYGYGSADAVVAAWINSPGHRANMLNASFTQIGVSVAYTPQGIPYFAQEFGAPTANNPTGTTSPTAGITASTGGATLTNTTTTTTSTPPASGPVSVSQGFATGSAGAGQIYAVGSGPGAVGTVTMYDLATGSQKFQIEPYGSAFRGGVRVAVADITGDGKQDVVVAPGAGTAPVVKVYDGVTGKLFKSFYAYSPLWTRGVNVAVGDVTGDGRADIVTGADAGGTPNVRAFNGKTFVAFRNFFAYASGFRGGVRVAVGDMNGDGKADIITAPGPGMSPIIKTFGATGGLLSSLYAYDPRWLGGAFVASGDINGDGRADIVVGADAGGGAQVRVFSGLEHSLLASFVTDSNFTGGVRVAVRDANGDGRAEIISAQGRGGRSVRLHSAGSSVLASFLAGDSNSLGGHYVG